MSITDELREYTEKQIKWLDMTKVHYRNLSSIADRIDAEHQKAIRELNNLADASVLLPVDADGVPIHARDVLDGYGKTIEVVELRYGRSGWVIVSRDGNAYADCAAFSHHHAPTVEDVLREFAQEMNDNLGMYTGEAIDADEWRDADAKTIADFAAKLRLADGKE